MRKYIRRDIGTAQQLVARVSRTEYARKLWITKEGMTRSERYQRIKLMAGEVVRMDHLGAKLQGRAKAEFLFDMFDGMPVYGIVIKIWYGESYRNYIDRDIYKVYNSLTQESREMFEILVLEEVLLVHEAQAKWRIRTSYKWTDKQVVRSGNTLKWLKYIRTGVQD